jgi:hypothetical protein
MFEDILETKEKKKNMKLVCPNCGTKILEIIYDTNDKDYDIQHLDHNCRICGGDRKA